MRHGDVKRGRYYVGQGSLESPDVTVRRALLSVSDKTGLVEFAQGLNSLGVKLISTGGTYNTLKDAGIPVTPVSQVTGFPEILDGRVKTLHPKIHGGILAIRGNVEHEKALASLGIEPIDLVVVNLYPFERTVMRAGVPLEEATENIDIGGPSMVRAAAKNFEGVGVVVNPEHYPLVLEELRARGGLSRETRMKLALEAFLHTARYDANIYSYLRHTGFSSQIEGEEFPEFLALFFEKALDLRYGENPHQRGSFYKELNMALPSIATASQLHGKELSYNNIHDANACLELLAEFDEPCVVAVKHANPCGVGCGTSILEAYKKAYESDPESIFGGIVGTNRPVDANTAEELGSV
ncbi:MAG: bifunctional phosphoribosylaminoimidazolecarboxamide formyltransferase/IMP cyclohydrolase, partial [Candidatus Aminicenantes bacterium]|nr:bifunctional phosphoribosylaminoimidazolecarboxamide formyltransferase/IMP cyclohydrolase [Candidatus Aminicenantes bacterium]